MRFLALFKNHKVDKVLVCIFEGFYLKIKDHFYIFNNVSIFVTPVSEVPHALDKDHSEFVSIFLYCQVFLSIVTAGLRCQCRAIKVKLKGGADAFYDRRFVSNGNGRIGESIYQTSDLSFLFLLGLLYRKSDGLSFPIQTSFQLSFPHFLLFPITRCPHTAIKFMTCVSCSERRTDKQTCICTDQTAKVNSGKMCCT